MNRRRFFALLPVVARAGEEMANDEVRKHLAAMRVAQRGHLNIDTAEGEYLYALVKRVNARRVLEIGTSNGYSAIWLAMGLRETGGKLVTLEPDKGRHELARANFKVTGLDRVIEARLAHARAEAGRLPGPWDIVFIDARAGAYPAYYDAVLPRVRRGGVILARLAGPIPDRVQSDPALRTEILRIGARALSASVKQ